jgi:hypothetical protein
MVRRAAGIAETLGVAARGYRVVFNGHPEAGQSVSIDRSAAPAQRA